MTSVEQGYAPVLHEDAGNALWSTANIGEALPGLCTPLTWTMWRTGAPAWSAAFYDLGLLDAAERDAWQEPEGRSVAVFFGRTAMNLDFVRKTVDRMPGGSANAFEAAVAGTVRPGMVDRPDEAARVVVAQRMAALNESIPVETRAYAARADEAWRRFTSPSSSVNWRDVMREGLSIFQDGQRIQTMVTMCSQNAFSSLAMALGEQGHPGLEMRLVTGYGDFVEGLMLQRLWDVSRERAGIDAFITDYGYQGSAVWRCRRCVLAGGSDTRGGSGRPIRVLLPDDHSPAAMAQRQLAEREDAEREVLAGKSETVQAELRTKMTAVAEMLPFRELGKSSFLQGIDLVRLAARHGAAELFGAGCIGSEDDVFYLTVEEMLGPNHAVASVDIAARRAERASYEGYELPSLFVGEPVPVWVESIEVSRESTIVGMGVSPGVLEGVARVILSADDMSMEPDEILIAPATDPSWSPFCLTRVGDGDRHRRTAESCSDHRSRTRGAVCDRHAGWHEAGSNRRPDTRGWSRRYRGDPRLAGLQTKAGAAFIAPVT